MHECMRGHGVSGVPVGLLQDRACSLPIGVLAIDAALTAA